MSNVTINDDSELSGKFPPAINNLLFQDPGPDSDLREVVDGGYKLKFTEDTTKAIKRDHFSGGGDITKALGMAVEAAYALGGTDWDDIYQRVIKQKISDAVDYYISNHLGGENTDSNRADFVAQAMIQFFKSGDDGKLAAKFKSLLFESAVFSSKVYGTYEGNNSKYYSPFAYLNIEKSAAGSNGATARDVFDVILAGTDRQIKSMSSVFSLLGLDEHLKQVLPSDIKGKIEAALDKDTLLEALLDQNKVDNDLFNEVVSGITGRDTEVTREVERRLRQCALFLYNIKNKSTWEPSVASEWGTNKPYSGRILPVWSGAIQADEFVNTCIVSPTAKYLFDNVNGKNADDVSFKGEFTVLNFGLSWIYSDIVNEKRTLKEIPIQLKASEAIGNVDKLKRTYPGYTEGIDNIASKTSFTNTYMFEDLNVTFEGNDPATSRTDVLVDINFKLLSMNALVTPVGLADIGGNIVPVLLKDLITLPNTNTLEVKDASSNTKTEYHPDYSRVRLKLYKEQDGESELILDLAMINHEISRDSESGETTLSISYRSYFEQSMHMPFNDALATPKIIDNREKRAEELRELVEKQQCSQDLLREKQRADNETSRLELISALEKGEFLERIYTSGILRKYKFKENIADSSGNIGGQSIGQTLNPKIDYVDSIEAATGSKTMADVATDAGLTYLSTDDEEDKIEATLEGAFINNYCFTLGDFLEMITDCLYETTTTQNSGTGFYTYTRSDEHRKYSKGMNMKFIVAPIKVANPAMNPPSIQISPVCLPIDLGYFTEWFYENYTKKGISSIQIGPFIRDLLERLINDVLYDTCYSFLLPEERPPQLIFNFFQDNYENGLEDTSTRGFFQTTKNMDGNWFLPGIPFGRYDSNLANAPSIKEFIQQNNRTQLMLTSHKTPVGMTKNYCCIHQTTNSSIIGSTTRALANLKDTLQCITLYSGVGFDNYLSDVTFSKTDVPHLRESRMFASDFGNLSLISNVYDLSFKFEGEQANTNFFPGMVFNFILTDFAGKTGTDFKAGDETNTEADPHTAKTLSHTMGFGGYYVVTKVKYNRKSEAKSWSIDIEAKYKGTDAVVSAFNNAGIQSLADQPKECLDSYNTSAIRVRSTSTQTGVSTPGMPIITGTGTETNTGTN